MHQKILEDIGLTQRESKTYLALLELGQTTVGPIAKKTAIQHAKIYPTLEKLIRKGLASYIIIKKTKHFEATNPKFLEKILSEKQKKLKDILPQLVQKKKLSQNKQLSKIYEGYQSIKALFESIQENLEKNDFYYAFAFQDEYKESIAAKSFFKTWHEQMEIKQINVKVIAHKSIQKEIAATYKMIKNTQLKFIKFNVPLGLAITKNTIINVVWGERPTAVQIESTQIANQYKEFFDEMWKIAKK